MSECAGSPHFDVCIVAWRSREVLRTCLRSLLGQPEVGRIVVVENASGDGTVEMVREEFPAVHLIANETNVNFAAGNNQAIRAASSPFVLLLNPDTEVPSGALRRMLEVFQEAVRIGAVAPQLRFPGGAIQRSCRGFPEPTAILFEATGLARLFPNAPAVSRYRLRGWDHNSRRDVDQPMASALALRRAALDDVGLFDESFPLYFNDVDLCYRLHQAGWRMVFLPEAKVIHHHGYSTRQVRLRALRESHHGLIRFYRKHYRGKISWLAYTSVIVFAWLTMWPRIVWAWIRK